LVLWFATAPALGSYMALPFCALLLPLFVLRLLNEEKVLRRELPGYAEYCEGTRYHLIPYIW
jgi:protein-S-isoprenylcysteine O-methyltransferase Ste14